MMPFRRLLRAWATALAASSGVSAATPDLPALWAERVKSVVAVEYVTVTETERRPTVSMGTVVVLTAAGTAGLVPMPIAVVCHEGSTVVVVLNALRLLRTAGPDAR